MKDMTFKVHKNLPNTDFVMENTFWIGLYPGLTLQHLEYSISKIKKFFQI
jgi:CDP-6-deoxy-D-xylo-4-hexulose-3-dehydrase